MQLCFTGKYPFGALVETYLFDLEYQLHKEFSAVTSEEFDKMTSDRLDGIDTAAAYIKYGRDVSKANMMRLGKAMIHAK